MFDNKWKSSIGLALAAAGGAVGLGNFLRFPGVAYLNGGGAFIVPYLICFFCIAIPLCLVEWSLGRGGGDQGKHSSSGVISTYVKNPLVRAVVGSLGTIIPVGVYFYYALIQAWCLGYLFVFLGVSPYEIPKTSQESIQLFQKISKSSTNSFEFSFPLICILLVTLG
jgi:SNF family Na+-dependent transporter